MRINEIITEVFNDTRLSSVDEAFNTSVQPEIIAQNSEEFTTSAKIGNRTIIFHARDFGWDGWYIDFTERGSKNRRPLDWIPPKTDRESYSATGSGNQMQVFSFVIQNIKTLVSLYDPPRIVFTAMKEGNRADLYAKIISRVQIPGYKLNEKLTRENQDKKIFVIDKVDNNA